MDTKRLSELKAPENIESAHVLGEENGTYVKFPARELGKVKAVNGAKPDENGNVAVPIPESITPPAAAAVGQTIVVKAVDENGKPTEWEAADFPKGASIDVTASVGQTIVVTEVDANGKPTKWEAADYQPRTHYEEIVELYSKTWTLESENTVDINLTEGETYYVTFNEVDYTCVGTVANDAELGVVVFIGNAAAFGQEDTGEPFLIVYIAAAGVPIGAIFDSTIEQADIVVRGKGYIPIPVQYVTNALPYYIEVTGSGTDEDPYVCHDTVANVEAIIDAGRTVCVRKREYAAGGILGAEQIYTYFLRGAGANGYVICFMGAVLGVGLGVFERIKLFPQSDGSYTVTVTDIDQG